MTQLVPNNAFYENIADEHNYTMFSMYPPSATTSSDSWLLTKEEKAMVRVFD